jgi:hypothetical protein
MVQELWIQQLCMLTSHAYLISKGAFTFANFARDFALSEHVLLQIFFVFITKRASLVQNRLQNRTNVNAPYRTFTWTKL